VRRIYRDRRVVVDATAARPSCTESQLVIGARATEQKDTK
jgi:hypothetical protein